jgi:hypothetical protein
MGLPGTGAHHNHPNIRDISCPRRAKGGNFSGHRKHLIIKQLMNAFEGLHLQFSPTSLNFLGRKPFYPANTGKFQMYLLASPSRKGT